MLKVFFLFAEPEEVEQLTPEEEAEKEQLLQEVRILSYGPSHFSPSPLLSEGFNIPVFVILASYGVVTVAAPPQQCLNMVYTPWSRSVMIKASIWFNGGLPCQSTIDSERE